MTDLIDRQSAIDAMCSICGVDCDKSKFVYDGKQEDQVILCPEHYALTQLPSAQPETHEERTEMHACDLISRHDAIEAHCELCEDRGRCNCDICPDVEVFQLLPPTQPEIIRCCDCKYYQFADNRAFGMPVKLCEWFGFEDVDDDDFCSRAERRGE